MSDEPNVNKYMGGYDDAAQFTNADPPPPKRVHAVNSGRVDPHLTHYVGVEAAAGLSLLFGEMLGYFTNNLTDEQAAYEITRFRARFYDLIGLQE